MKPILRILSVPPVAVASAALFVLMVLTFVDVILRSTINNPIEAATELTRILMAVVVFAALPVVSARDQHITVDLADPLFRRARLERLRDGLVATVSGAMLFWPALRVADLAKRHKNFGDVTEYLAIPTFYIEYFISGMTFATALVLILRGLVLWFAPHLLTRQND
ncbi:MAG: TRAP transporter small permease [Pseudooceanicola sp.]|nr:TRAP transporter small permease [Pseudooceanicola sp.]